MHVTGRSVCVCCGIKGPRCCCTAQIPFVKRAPLVTFRKPIGSVSVSGHKFIGAPVPCGVVITRQRYVEALSRCDMFVVKCIRVGTELPGWQRHTAH